MRKYKEDYETLVTTDESGREKTELVYRGPYFEINNGEEDLIKFKKHGLLLITVIVFAHIIGGFLNNRGMYQLYVALPYVIAFFPLIYLIEAVIRLPKKKRPYRRDEIGRSFDRLKTSSFVFLALAGGGVLGEIVFLLIGSGGDLVVQDFFYLMVELLAAAAIYILIQMQRKIHVRKRNEK